MRHGPRSICPPVSVGCPDLGFQARKRGSLPITVCITETCRGEKVRGRKEPHLPLDHRRARHIDIEVRKHRRDDYCDPLLRTGFSQGTVWTKVLGDDCYCPSESASSTDMLHI